MVLPLFKIMPGHLFSVLFAVMFFSAVNPVHSQNPASLPKDTTLPLPEKSLRIRFRVEQDCILFNDYQYFGPGDLSTSRQKTEYQ